ncbi:MAG: hypothetical protein IH613_06215, partial [Desulfuromonadales bacterium]|nr:hypothetical protein [Desulfuromonadales bacterium]
QKDSASKTADTRCDESPERPGGMNKQKLSSLDLRKNTIGAQFFPSEDKPASIINAFGVFAAGYMMRPLGGVIFGHIGDRLGRKKALQISVAMMALPTFLLGFVVAGFGLWMRKGLVESPDFERQKVSGQIVKSPVFEALKTMPGRIFHVLPSFWLWVEAFTCSLSGGPPILPGLSRIRSPMRLPSIPFPCSRL